MKRSVAYIRVSTKSDAQLHSYDFQENYWRQTISNKPDEGFIGLYADWGISGRSLERRPQFLQMLDDAREGKFDIIYTKSVSRFARNTKELLETIHELRDLGIKVIFEKENINSLDPSAEIYLTIAAAVAESELKAYSENQKWSYQERFKNGYIWQGSKILGYDMNNETNTLEIVEDEALVVKKIFNLYLEGLSMTKIAIKLKQDGDLTVNKDTNWIRSTIKYILSNVKYKGNAISQLYVNINGTCKRNKGYAKKYYMEQTHEPIIEPEVFDRVQEIIKERALEFKPKSVPKKLYPFTGLIECGVCHAMYNHKFNHTNKPWRSEIWICKSRNDYSEKKCDNSRIKDSVLKDLFVEAYNEFIKMKYTDNRNEELNKELEALLDQQTELSKLRVNQLITIDDYNESDKEIKQEIKVLLNKISSQKISGVTRKDYTPIDVFNEEKVYKFIDKIIINHYHITFRFYNGVEITKEYSNGESGNKKGWKTNKLEE